MSICAWLSQVDSPARWGRSAYLLRQAEQSGATSMPSFVISADLLKAIIQQSATKKVLKEIQAVSIKEAAYFAGLAKDLRTSLVQAKIEPAEGKVLVGYYQHLRESLLLPAKVALPLAFITPEEVYRVEVHTPAQFIIALKQAYALSITEHLLYHRRQQKEKLIVPYPVLVQYDAEPEFSGTVVGHDTRHHDDLTLEIHASPKRHPSHQDLLMDDVYWVDKKSLMLLQHTLRKQWWAHHGKGTHATARIGASTPVLSDKQLLDIARQSRMAQAQFPDPQVFQWSYVHKQFFITGVQPFVFTAISTEDEDTALLRGLPGGVGQASGTVRHVVTTQDQAKVQPGDVVVVEQLKQQDYRWLAGCAAVITEVGSLASVEGQLTRHMGTPSVLATAKCCSVLQNGQLVTVDGQHGVVYAGAVIPSQPVVSNQLITGTKLYVSISDSSQLATPMLQSAAGIGLLRGEFILRMLGMHPDHILRKGRSQEYVYVLSDEVLAACKSVYPSPVMYQLHDLESSTLLGLKPRSEHRHEPNPALGYRGSHRLLEDSDLLQLELAALSRVAKNGGSNIQIMLPMVRSIDEVRQLRAKIMVLADILPIRLWVKIETPALSILAKELCAEDIQGVIIDLPSLTQFITGLDKENRQLAHHINYADPAVMETIRYTIASCREAGVACTLLVEEGEPAPEVVQVAVENGVTGIVVDGSVLQETQQLVASIERHLLLEERLEIRYAE